MITPGASQIETTVVGRVSELAPDTRKALEAAAKDRGVALPNEFAVSEMFIQMLTRDPSLELRTGAWVEELSKVQTSPQGSERIFNAFLSHLNGVATGGSAGTKTASAR